MGSSNPDADETGRRRLIDRIIWLCPILGLLAAAGLLWVFGVTLWTALAAAVVIGCPIAVAWALFAARLSRPKP